MHAYPPVCPLSGGLHALVVGQCQHQQLHPHHRCGQRRQPHHGGAALRRCPLRLPVLCGGHAHPGTFPAGLLAAKDGANAPSGGAVCHRVGAQRLSQERRVRFAGAARPPALNRHNTLRKKKKVKGLSHQTFLGASEQNSAAQTICKRRPFSSDITLTGGKLKCCVVFSTLTHG